MTYYECHNYSSFDFCVCNFFSFYWYMVTILLVFVIVAVLLYFSREDTLARVSTAHG